ncbi:dipeptide ABC transporter ATP-binding protein [Bauldia sp.]|uniref:dipeptide ABC transporter ATP-binding protein n=1 Tax=Bauldia sp. TaxID=2575872 RepID=UPI003BA9C6C6
MALLTIDNLTVEFPSRFGVFTAVSDFDLTLERGEIHGLVGESGAGKSTVGAAILGLLPGTGRIAGGSITLEGEELTHLDQRQWHALRGKRVGMIFQNPQTSLDPLFTVEDQLVETIRRHSDVSHDEALTRALALLEEVGIRDARTRMHDYPHQFSGGMRQRVVIALVLASDPNVIIADEPTTALDVAIQNQILDVIRGLAASRGVGVLLITHNMGVIAEVTDRVSVLLDGRCVESGPTTAVLGNPQDPYTRSLIASVPRLDVRLERFPAPLRTTRADPEPTWSVPGASAELASEWLLEGPSSDHGSATASALDVENLTVVFSVRRSLVRPRAEITAVDDVSFRIDRGETLGLVGESGSGKSTVARAIVGLVPGRNGRVLFAGRDLPLSRRRPADDPSRREIQMIFQDPYSSLNNRWRVGDIIAEPLRFYRLAKSKDEARRIAASMLLLVGLPQDAMLKYPHQFSGGQRQRIAIARALVARPELLICDEPTSALDVSVQAQVLNLFKEIQARFGLAILFISHDLPVVRQMADTVAVLHNGSLVEAGPAEPFFRNPASDYARTLLAEMPSLAMLADPERLAAAE